MVKWGSKPAKKAKSAGWAKKPPAPKKSKRSWLETIERGLFCSVLRGLPGV